MTLARIFALVMLAYALAVPAKIVAQNAPPTRAEVQAFLNQISSLPIEYRADLTLSLVNQAPALVSPMQRRHLVMSIFNDAHQAQYQTPLWDATNSFDLLAHQEALNLSWLHLDALELQLHAISALHATPSQSFRLFNRIAFSPTRMACSDAMVPYYGPYYDRLAAMLKELPGPTLPDGTPREAYLETVIQNAKSPAQLKAFLSNYPAVNLEPAERETLQRRIEAALSSLVATDREMSGIEGRDGEMTDVVKKLLTTSGYSGAKGAALLTAFRAFLITGLHAEACEASTLDRAKVAARFNALDPSLIGDAPKPVSPLTAKDLAPTRFVPTPSFEKISSSATQMDQMHRLFQIFVANQKTRDSFSSAASFTQPEPSDIHEVLLAARSPDEYTNDHDSDLLQYEDKQSIVMLLITILPPGPSFRDAIDAEASFLNLNPIEQINPPAWLRPLKHLILISRIANGSTIDEMRKETAGGKALIMTPSPDRDSIIATLKRYDADRIISAYLGYEDLVRPPYVTFQESGHVW